MTGLPPVSLQALLIRQRFPEAIAQPGIAGLLMRPLAALGRMRRFPMGCPEYEPDDK